MVKTVFKVQANINRKRIKNLHTKNTAMPVSKENDEQRKTEKLERMRNRVEINNTIILAIATLAITWCSYQSNLWSGIQTFKLAEANKLNRLAQGKAALTVQYQA